MSTRTAGYGDGDYCIVNPEHGRMYTMGSGKQWCPHSDHSSLNRSTEEIMAFRPKKGASSLDAKPAKPARAAKPKAENVAKNPEDMPVCLCGCGERTKGGRFRPGHDARYHSAQKKAAEPKAE